MAPQKHLRHVGHFFGIETGCREVQFIQFLALFEHARHVCHIGRIERSQVQVFQFGALGKHKRHVSYVGGIKTADIQVFQFFALVEHAFHRGGIGGHKSAQVEAFKRLAAGEHITHIHRFHRVQIGEILYLFEVLEAIEEFGSRFGLCCFDRLVQNDFLYGKQIADRIDPAVVVIECPIGYTSVGTELLVIPNGQRCAVGTEHTVELRVFRFFNACEIARMAF